MAYIDKWEPINTGLTTGAVDAAREDFRQFFWLWFENNKDDVLFKVSVLFFAWKFTVEDLRPLFVKLFGAL